MTWPEVADTALKIGLSGFIGGMFAYRLAKRSQAHDMTKERMRRVQDSLERVSMDLEKAHAAFVARCSTYYHIAHPDVANEALRESRNMLLTLHQLEGRLLLLDMVEAARSLRQYRLGATDIEEVAISDNEAPIKLGPVAERLCTLKEGIYKSLSKEYNGA